MITANKLAREQADVILAKAREEMKVFGSLTLGRALFNCLTLRQISNIIQPERDFFHVRDEERVLELFNKYLVIEEISK